MIKTKKQMFIIIGVFTLILMLFTGTYAFFNYTRTGSSNTIKVGRISFISRQTNTINLTNMFPIDPTETGIMNDDTKVGTLEIKIEGDTDYNNGIEYLISSVNSNIYTNQGQLLPISLDITVTNLGTPTTDYFTERDSMDTTIYKRLVSNVLGGDERLLVGYIKKNTTSGTKEGVNGTITIKAYLDKNRILISDTYDGTESDDMGTTNAMAEGKTVITTAEWNAIQSSGVSFKIKVEANEGIWVNQTFNDILQLKNMNSTTNIPVMDNVASEFVSASTGINFANAPSNTNGKGLYMHAGTENDTYPMLYYRGSVDDNNVLFANKCWKIVRTTDTGGIKLLYAGVPGGARENLTRDEYGTPSVNTADLSFDDNELVWTKTLTETIPTSNKKIFTFNIVNDGNYLMEIYINTSDPYKAGLFFSINDSYTDSYYTSDVYVLGEDNSNKPTVMRYLENITSSDTLKIQFWCESTEQNPSTIKIVFKKRNTALGMVCDNLNQENSINLNNTVKFAYNEHNKQSYTVMNMVYAGYMYGKEYEYKSGTVANAYYSSSFEYDDFDNNGTTEYKLSGNINNSKSKGIQYSCGITTRDGTCEKIRYYLEYSGSYYIELENGTDINEAMELMQENTTNSDIKNTIDEWYRTNLIDYTDYLEDTIWCNKKKVVINNGLIGIEYSTAVNKSDFTCRKLDAFTVNSERGNKKLDYPIALLTFPELKLSGGTTRQKTYIGFHDGNTQDELFYTMSPSTWWDDILNNLPIYYSLDSATVTNTKAHVRPSVSLKNNTQFVRGTGTASDPYVVE